MVLVAERGGRCGTGGRFRRADVEVFGAGQRCSGVGGVDGARFVACEP